MSEPSKKSNMPGGQDVWMISLLTVAVLVMYGPWDAPRSRPAPAPSIAAPVAPVAVVPSAAAAVVIASAAPSAPPSVAVQSPPPVEPTGPLAKGVATGPAAPPVSKDIAFQGRRRALCIGVANYKEPRLRLQAAARDAEALATLLRERSRTLGFDVTVLTNEKATRVAILDAVTNLTKQSGTNDTILISFSGHGQLDEQGDHYLIPYDGDPEHLESTAVPMDKVRAPLARAGAPRRIMLLDACFSGADGTNLIAAAKASSSQILPDKVLQEMSKGSGTFILASSRADERSFEDVGPGGSGLGFFTKHVLAGLRGAADKLPSADPDAHGNSDGLVSMDELADYVRNAANQDVTTKVHNTQRARKLFEGDQQIYIALAPGTGAPAATTAVASDATVDPALPDAVRPIADRAASGQVEAQYELAKLYSAGEKGVTKDSARAVEMARKAADKGHPDSVNLLATLTADPREAQALFKKAAELGSSEACYALGMRSLNGESVPRDTQDAAQWFRKSAEKGNASAQAMLGSMCERGEGAPVDMTQAASWYRKAAEQGNAAAQHDLAWLCKLGEGVTKDPAESARWFQKSADQGLASAQCQLGLMYAAGAGVTKSATDAANWLRKAAEQGDKIAQNELGLLYQQGDGVTRDEAEALRWYRKAADQGSRDAQVNLALAYLSGAGVPKDAREAANWLRKAADQGSAQAQYKLGVLYRGGEGLDKDAAQAAVMIRKAADQGLREAMNDMGYLCSMGEGVALDPKETVRWYTQAAEKGDARAQVNLGVLYERGEGVGKDAKTAASWYRKAADQNSVAGQYNLGLALRYGRGVTADPTEAARLFSLAAGAGNVDAMYEMGLACRDGKGAPKDKSTAAFWLRKASDLNHAPSKAALKKLEK